ncbi:VOC family protein [Pseudomonas sp. SCB32]|uniref:VOC family protein n=1 Tax=Pseudomonas sp. SCB32 TaxID=2653853 RepID=UPI003557711C
MCGRAFQPGGSTRSGKEVHAIESGQGSLETPGGRWSVRYFGISLLPVWTGPFSLAGKPPCPLPPLSSYSRAESHNRRFGWVSDRFGVSWQLSLPLDA